MPSALAGATGRVGMLDPDPLGLDQPERGDAVLRHDPEFVALDRGLSTLRDTINFGIDALNHVGAGLRKLPEGSLEELLVMPLVGDYLTIRQNAAALKQVRDALATYSGNVARLSLAVDPRWGGEAATAYLARLNIHALVALGAGELLEEGDVVFEAIALHSEKLAIETEELIVELCERGGRLATKLLARVCGPAGAVVFAADFALKGFDAVTDIIDDIQRVIEIVDWLVSIQTDVQGWVDEQRERVAAVAEIGAVVAAGLRGR